MLSAHVCGKKENKTNPSVFHNIENGVKASVWWRHTAPSKATRRHERAKKRERAEAIRCNRGDRRRSGGIGGRPGGSEVMGGVALCPRVTELSSPKGNRGIQRWTVGGNAAVNGVKEFLRGVSFPLLLERMLYESAETTVLQEGRCQKPFRGSHVCTSFFSFSSGVCLG